MLWIPIGREILLRVPHRVKKQPQAELHREVFQVPSIIAREQQNIRRRRHANIDIRSRSCLLPCFHRDCMLSSLAWRRGQCTCIRTSHRFHDESSACRLRRNTALSIPSMQRQAWWVIKYVRLSRTLRKLPQGNVRARHSGHSARHTCLRIDVPNVLRNVWHHQKSETLALS